MTRVLQNTLLEHAEKNALAAKKLLLLYFGFPVKQVHFGKCQLNGTPVDSSLIRSQMTVKTVCFHLNAFPNKNTSA